MPTLFTRSAIVVVPVARRSSENTAARTVDPQTDLETFRSGLSPTGNTPATHHWCRWSMTEAEYARALVQWPDGVNGVRFFDAGVVRPSQVLSALSLLQIRGPS